jgi:hypothetical protein
MIDLEERIRLARACNCSVCQDQLIILTELSHLREFVEEVKEALNSSMVNFRIARIERAIKKLEEGHHDKG